LGLGDARGVVDRAGLRRVPVRAASERWEWKAGLGLSHRHLVLARLLEAQRRPLYKVIRQFCER